MIRETMKEVWETPAPEPKEDISEKVDRLREKKKLKEMKED